MLWRLVSPMGLLLQACIMQTARMVTLSFWTIYNPSLRNRMLLYQIHPEVVVGRPFMMVSVAVVLQSKCSGNWNVAYASGVIFRHVLYAVTGDDCKTCVTSLVLVSTNAFMYFREHEEEELSLTHPYERVVQTVSSSITLLDGTMADVAQPDSLDEKITISVNTADFEWIWSSGCFTTKR